MVQSGRIEQYAKYGITVRIRGASNIHGAGEISSRGASDEWTREWGASRKRDGRVIRDRDEISKSIARVPADGVEVDSSPEGRTGRFETAITLRDDDLPGGGAGVGCR